MFITKNGEKSLSEFLNAPDTDKSVFFKIEGDQSGIKLNIKEMQQDNGGAVANLSPADATANVGPSTEDRESARADRNVAKRIAIIGGTICLLLIISRRY